MIEVAEANGIYITDIHGKTYADLNSGYSVSALGHGHPDVIEAIRNQAGKYLHTSVYGEHIQSPQVRYAEALTGHLDPSLNCVFFVNSGAECVEGAMKLAKRITGRHCIIACENAYHGSTHGADSLRSDISYINAFMPLLPGIRHIRFGELTDLSMITTETAGVIIEPIQAEAGIMLPPEGYLAALRNRCNEVGALLILDEIQTGMGRTGSFCAHQQFGVVPDILLLAKALGFGLPLGAIVSRKTNLDVFTRNPELGHLTTFGGNPLCCCAGLAGLRALIDGNYISEVTKKHDLFKEFLVHPGIQEIRGMGLLLAVELVPEISVPKLVNLLREHGIITDMFLFEEHALRVAPPLTISQDDINASCSVILQVLDML